MGAAYLMAKSGLAVASMSVMRPELVMKSIVSVVMAGLLGGMKVEADRDESSTYAVMLASDVSQRYLFFNSEKIVGLSRRECG
ncbi:hypothetical protein ACFX14_004664 [Malus domestica]|uniref:uncharacterized protein isoform X1 n=1 Tax=Malus domestica TaxID=3750 RepID=UPI0007ED253E|nr:V-type proton ATPase 16 kDa proteolipid subunit-like [Malus domestica]XP_028966045.1 V-type proton ATPase 16 kDa proteolipid subunit-like [Malus domestica]